MGTTLSTKTTRFIKVLFIFLVILEFGLTFLIFSLLTIISKFSKELLIFWVFLLVIIGFSVWEAKGIFWAKKVINQKNHLIIGKNNKRIEKSEITKVDYSFPVARFEYIEKGRIKEVSFIPQRRFFIKFGCETNPFPEYQ